MERWQTKAVCGAIMLVAILVCFLLPIKLTVFFRRRGDNGQYFLDLLACFAGGVFLAAYLIFMAPAVRELIVESLMKPNGVEYPLPDMFIGVGFFILLLLNRVVISMSKASRKGHAGHHHAVASTSNNSNQLALIDSNGQSSHAFDPASSRANTETHLVDMTSMDDKPENGHALQSNHQAARRSSKSCHHEVVEMEDEDLVFQSSSHSPYPLPRRSSIADVAQQESTARSVVMMLALSLDSVLEGIATGLKMSNVEVWALFVGNLVHESVIAFCLGLQLVRVHDASSKRPVVIAAVAYALMNPIGVLIATAIFESSAAGPNVDLYNGLVQALTAGCFIYVTFCEILEGQITHRTSYAKIACMFAGFALLAAFAAVPGSSSYSLGGCDVGDSTAVTSEPLTTITTTIADPTGR